MVNIISELSKFKACLFCIGNNDNEFHSMQRGSRGFFINIEKIRKVRESLLKLFYECRVAFSFDTKKYFLPYRQKS